MTAQLSGCPLINKVYRDSEPQCFVGRHMGQFAIPYDVHDDVCCHARLAHASPISFCWFNFNSAFFWYFAIGDKPYQCDVMAVPWSLDLASSDMTSCKNNIKILLGLGLNIMCNKEETATTRVLVFTNLLNMLNLFLFLFNPKSAN